MKKNERQRNVVLDLYFTVYAQKWPQGHNQFWLVHFNQWFIDFGNWSDRFTDIGI